MSKETGIVTDSHPKWLDTIVPSEYEDNALYEIILFFVIHSPCRVQSANSISLTDRGWKPKPWYSPKYLKERLDFAIFGNDYRLLKMCDSKHQMLSEIQSMDLDENFYSHQEKQRFLFVKVSKNGCGSEYMSLFYHIRNALAHGRIAMYPAKNKDVTFVMEDGKEIDEKAESFEVSARIVIKKSSLSKIITILKNPPIDTDYSEDILLAIKNGHNTKKRIIQELEMDEYTYNRFTQSLRMNRLIKYEHNQWHRVEEL